MRKLLAVASLALMVTFVGCGKNDDTVASIPISQAPAPSQYGYLPTNAQYPNFPQVNGYQNYYNPQQQQGSCPNQTCYMYQPIQNYMQQYPQMQAYWQPFWYQFVDYCDYYGVDPYSQNGWDYFWYDYCPYEWPELTYYFEPYYNWYQPQYELPSNVNSGYFWYYYYGMSFDNSGSCGSYYCY